jgi:hypothetical protein
VSLNDGSYLLCWTTGTAEQGRSALAQSFNADGSSHGGPVVISRPEVDVIDTPRVNTKNDAGHIVATFAAAYESTIALVEVPLDVLAEGSQGGDVIAAK